MAKNAAHAISPTRRENYPEWYQQVVKAAELAENSPVRGCMVIKPWGYAIWELMQRALDAMIKDTGHENACFPLLIPLSFLEKEAEHVDGFAKECAVVTHHRLESDGDGKLVAAGKLDEPYIIRPTSETIIGHSYSKWVQSYRDLPILINQWANVMRWEMRPRIFLRTSEFLWQEGHTAHASIEEAQDETLKMLDVYADFVENWLAVPVTKGIKTAGERFPGAVDTYTIEAMMQDGKALQAGTSHFLGQNFSKASNISFLDKDGNTQFAWTTSWGVSTRLMGALIMAHSDDDGLVLPPRVAPKQLIINPIFKSEEEKTLVMGFCESLATEIRSLSFRGQNLRVGIDQRDVRGGEKAWQQIKKGVPIRLEIGPRDVAKNSVCLKRRDQSPREKAFVERDVLLSSLETWLEEIQDGLFKRALEFRDQHSKEINTLAEFESYFSESSDQAVSGFVRCHWHDSAQDHALLKKFKISPRCIPLVGPGEEGLCPFTGKPSSKRVILARSY